MALNSMRCATTQSAETLWMLGMAAYEVLEEMGMGSRLSNFLINSYPYICTCVADEDIIVNLLNVDPDTYTALIYDAFNSCSETVLAETSRIKYESEMSLHRTDLSDTTNTAVVTEAANAMANKMFNYGDVDENAQLTWAEWSDVMLYEYDWGYPTTDEQTYIQNVFYDVAYGNSYCTDNSFCTET